MADLPPQSLPETTPETLITFPCDFPIKVMGETHGGFISEIINVIQHFDTRFDASKIEIRASAQGNFTSLTCNVYVESKPQLDAIYTALSQHHMVKVAL